MAELNGAVSADEASATSLGIGDSRIAVHCDLGSETSGKEMGLSQLRRDGKAADGGVESCGRG